MGYKLENMDMTVSLHSTPYNPYLPADEEADGQEETEGLKNIRNKFKNKAYWVVYFAPKNKRTLDGDIGFFINKKTLEMILIRSFLCRKPDPCF